MKKQALRVDNEQAELLAEIGAYLRKLRQDQDLSLEDVASTTLIPVRTLTAIEEGDLKRLPEPVYVQGFIRRYADAIGVNGLEFASAFPTNIQFRPLKPSWRGTIEAQLRPVHLYMVYTLLVLSAVSGLSYLMNRSAAQNPRYVQSPQVPDQQEPRSPSEFYGPPVPRREERIAATNASQTVRATPVSGKPVRVSLTVRGQQSWLRIVVDGKTDFEGMLPQGSQRTWMAEEQVTVRAGDAGAIEVSYNESPPSLLGSPGDVQEKTFGKDATINVESLNTTADSQSISQAY